MIEIPQLFQQKLAGSQTLNAAVSNSFTKFEPWLASSGMPFFPGFTDHSPRHISDVLKTAASLISDDSQELLTAEDVAVLCIAILLHDCAMHLTQDGFRALKADSGKSIVSGFGDKPWSQLWQDFTAEARRFGEDKLLAIFGDNEPLTTEDIDYNNLSEKDCLLIGEFVRRHHARLAHEIAIKGVPSLSETKLELDGFDNDLKDIAGLIARSHGMSLRDTFSYLEDKYDLIHEQGKIKGPYLMAVLRIADYVQVQSERALKSLMSVKELRSPISRQEWRNHFAVKSVSPYHDDPEAYFVNTEPRDVKTYLRLVSLFKDIQRELDESWATIGEIYGRRGHLASLGLTMRRIRSSLDSAEKFSQRVEYIPIEAGFKSSGLDLLKLLIGPLYDYKATVGVRELIQNAVDACKELSDLPGVKSPIEIDGHHQEPDIILSIDENDDGSGWITVTDRGVGMTLDTVTKYFLIAGASFRNSDLWKRRHMDESGQTRVMRGGRFGVGALAAFLLGEEIEVKTRAFDRDDSEGIVFKARLDDPIIELRRCIAPVGTTIKVWVSDPKIIDELRPPRIYNKLKLQEFNLHNSWGQVDWFAQAEPRIEYRWNGYTYSKNNFERKDDFRFSAKFLPKNEDAIPLQKSSLIFPWHKLPNPDPYKDIYWRYCSCKENKNGEVTWESQKSDEVTVNGIRVQSFSNTYEYHRYFLELPKMAINEGPNYRIMRPSMAIFDPTGICPINLQRSSISFERMGMDSSISKAVLDVHLRNIIQRIKSTSTVSGFYKLSTDIAVCRDVSYFGKLSIIFATSEGGTIRAPNALTDLGIKKLYFIKPENKKSIRDIKLFNILNEDEALVFWLANPGYLDDLDWFRGIFSSDYRRTKLGFPSVSFMASTLIMPLKKWQFVNEKKRITRALLNTLKTKELENGFISAASGNVNNTSQLLSRCQSISKLIGEDLEIGGWALSDDQAHGHKSSLIVDMWCQINNGEFIVNFDL